MSTQHQAFRSKIEIETCLAMAGELAHFRYFPFRKYSERRGKEASQENAVASVLEWRSRNVHAAGGFIEQSRVSSKTPAEGQRPLANATRLRVFQDWVPGNRILTLSAIPTTSAFTDMAYSEERNTLRLSMESYRRQYSTRAFLNETDYLTSLTR